MLSKLKQQQTEKLKPQGSQLQMATILKTAFRKKE